MEEIMIDQTGIRTRTLESLARCGALPTEIFRASLRSGLTVITPPLLVFTPEDNFLAFLGQTLIRHFQGLVWHQM